MTDRQPCFLEIFIVIQESNLFFNDVYKVNRFPDIRKNKIMYGNNIIK
jgi:hypothetical protein